MASLQNLGITKEHVEECIRASVNLDGWETFKIFNEDHIFALKIRKPYEDGESKVNEDGYKYDKKFINIHQTRHYLFLKSKGYDVDSIITI